MPVSVRINAIAAILRASTRKGQWKEKTLPDGFPSSELKSSVNSSFLADPEVRYSASSGVPATHTFVNETDGIRFAVDFF
jgi:hypothetical protein